MKILITGHRSVGYNRDLIIIQGLRALGVEVVEVPIGKKERNPNKLIINHSQGIDFVLAPSFSHEHVRRIKRLLPNVPLIFDPLVSRYLTKVFDYKAVWKYSPRALKNYLKDYFSFRACDILLADTQAHKDYYVKTFGIKPEKIHVVPVGAPTDVFFPMEKAPSDQYVVGFYGNFVPLQGAQRIVAAARLLQGQSDIQFKLIGHGTDFDLAVKTAKGLPNIEFLGHQPYESLNGHLASFDVCLGIFGDSPKADLVIPNKIFHYAACRKPIITKDSAGIREIFTHGKDALLTGSRPQEIAEAIVRLKSNPELKEQLAGEAYRLVASNYNAKSIGQLVLNSLHAYKSTL